MPRKSQTDNVDDWGFTDADHVELRALMKRHHERLPDVLLALMMEDGITPMLEDPGIMGEIARSSPEGTTRVFPTGGLWRALLEHLRELDKGGA